MRRLIDKKWVECIDVGCNDFEAARLHRQMVGLKQNIEGYLYIEALIRGWPRNKPLPKSLYGTLPTVGKHETLSGFHEVE